MSSTSNDDDTYMNINIYPNTSSTNINHMNHIPTVDSPISIPIASPSPSNSRFNSPHLGRHASPQMNRAIIVTSPTTIRFNSP